MTANDNIFYLGHLNKLVDKFDNNYHQSIGKKPVDAYYSALTEEIETNPKLSKLEFK